MWTSRLFFMNELFDKPSALKTPRPLNRTTHRFSGGMVAWRFAANFPKRIQKAGAHRTRLGSGSDGLSPIRFF